MNRLHSLMLAGIAASLGACASLPEDQRSPSDPWEPTNRTLYKVNDAVDRATLKPVSKGYRAVVPGPARKGVSNFFKNLTTPRSALNNLLQGKPRRGVSDVARFLVNSTVGIGGLFDVASASGLEEYNEDFGQTFAVWGMPDGPYVMIPLFGPRTLRDAIALPLDTIVDPLFQYDNKSVRDPLYGLRLIDLRYRLLAAEKLLEDSKDPYVTLRESYLQNRAFEIYDGDPPEDDEFFDEFLDEEE